MKNATDDVRIIGLRPLLPPAILLEEIPVSDGAAKSIVRARKTAQKIISGEDNRLLVVVGPCSIHDPEAAFQYGKLIREAQKRFGSELFLVMRVYFEKPRTTVGWKGLINDPDLNDTFEINKGLRIARGLLALLAENGVPAGTEFLDTITPQYIADLISWGAIGARTTESQVHRELTSGLSMPVGFKNGTDGNIGIGVDAIGAARHSHRFLSVTKQGISAIVATKGNDSCHLILRGGSDGPNFDAATVSAACKKLEQKGYVPRLMVDCSHGNSQKDPSRQWDVCQELATRIREGEKSVFGLMIESNLIEGRQDCGDGISLVYGQSITDACLGWENTIPLLEELADAVAVRNNKEQPGGTSNNDS
jgi:3-deoxy-7-phosphoheptulonate synthase